MVVIGFSKYNYWIKLYNQIWQGDFIIKINVVHLVNKAFLNSKVETGAVNANLENSISGIKISKAFVSHKSEQKKFEEG